MQNIKYFFSSIRFRFVYMGLGSLLVLSLWMITDPDLGLIQNLPFGGATLATLVFLSKAVLYVAMMHLSRRALIDYVDLEEYMNKAKESPDGAARVVQAVSIFCVAIAILIYAAVGS